MFAKARTVIWNILCVAEFMASIVVSYPRSCDVASITQMVSTLLGALVRISTLWIPLLNLLFDANSCTNFIRFPSFPLLQFHQYHFVICTYFTGIKAASTIIDGVMNQVTRKIFNTNLTYYRVYIIPKLGKRYPHSWVLMRFNDDSG